MKGLVTLYVVAEHFAIVKAVDADFLILLVVVYYLPFFMRAVRLLSRSLELDRFLSLSQCLLKVSLHFMFYILVRGIFLMLVSPVQLVLRSAAFSEISSFRPLHLIGKSV